MVVEWRWSILKLSLGQCEMILCFFTLVRRLSFVYETMMRVGGNFFN